MCASAPEPSAVGRLALPVRATLAVMLAAPLVFLAIAALGGRAGAGGAGAGIPGAAAADTTRPALSRQCEQVYAAWDCTVSWTTPPGLRPAPEQYRLLYSIGGGPAVRPSTAFPADNRRHRITGIPPDSTVSVTVYPEAPVPGLGTPAPYTLRAHRSQLRFTTGPVEAAADQVELGRAPLEIECQRGGVGTDDAANFRCTLTAGFPAVLPATTSVQYELWYSVGDGDPAKHGVQTAVTFPGAGNSAVPAAGRVSWDIPEQDSVTNLDTVEIGPEVTVAARVAVSVSGAENAGLGSRQLVHRTPAVHGGPDE